MTTPDDLFDFMVWAHDQSAQAAGVVQACSAPDLQGERLAEASQAAERLQKLGVALVLVSEFSAQRRAG